MGKQIRRTAAAILFVGFLASGTAGAPFLQQIGSGMVGFWRLENATSPSTDSSGNNNTSSAWPAGVSVLPGPLNTPAALGANSAACLDFDGSTGVVSVPSTAALNITGDITIALWIYKNTEAGDWVRLVGKGAAGVRTFGVWEENGAGANILFQMYSGGNAVLNFQSTGNIPLNAWTHVACRLQGNAASIWINGAASGTGTRTGTPSTSNDPVTFGYAGFHTYWDGRMDDIRIYDRWLPDADIIAIAAGGQGPAAPTNLVATAGNNSVQLTWAGGTGVYNIKRGTTPGGPYTTIMSNVGTTSFTDSTVTVGTTYYYVVSCVSYGESPNSNEASATPLPVTATPTTGIQTSENITTTTFTVSYLVPAPAGGSTLTVTSGNLSEGTVSMPALLTTPVPGGFSYFVAAGLSPTFTVTVTGVDDLLVDGDITYPINVSASGFPAIPPVLCTNHDNDVQGLDFSATSGVVTSENPGGVATYTVRLNRKPYGNVAFGLSSSDTTEGTVSPSTLTFTNGSVAGDPLAWNVAHTVTVTGVDDTLLDFSVAYTIIPGALQFADTLDQAAFAAAGVTAAPTVSCMNLDNEVPPVLDPVWGSGCGLLGSELLILWGAARLWRRRRRSP